MIPRANSSGQVSFVGVLNGSIGQVATRTAHKHKSHQQRASTTRELVLILACSETLNAARRRHAVIQSMPACFDTRAYHITF